MIDIKITITATIGDSEGYIQSMGNLGDVYLQRKEFAKANEFYLKAIKYADDNSCSEFYILPAIYLGLIQSELFLGNKDNAVELKDRAIEISSKTGREDIIEHIGKLI